MKALVLLATLSSGCFTSWAITQASGTQRILDEGGHEAIVPLAGTVERLTVTMHLAATPATVAPAAAPSPAPFELTCSVSQSAKEEVSLAAFRYGSRWKKTTAVMFALEAGFAALMLLTEPEKEEDKLGYQIGGAFLAADALGTAALFFVPRKEVFRTETRAQLTPIRTDCPEGLVMSIGGQPFPVDAAGRITETGDTALDAWMQAPSGYLGLALGNQPLPFQFSEADRCMWNRQHHQAVCSYANRTEILASIEVPLGALTTVVEHP